MNLCSVSHLTPLRYETTNQYGQRSKPCSRESENRGYIEERKGKCLYISIKLKPTYCANIATKPYPSEYKVPNLRSLTTGRATPGSTCSLDSMGPHAHFANLYLKEFSKSLTDRTYTWYVNLKPGTVHDGEHLISLFNTNFFFAEAKFTLAELGSTPQHSDEDHDIHVRRFHEKARGLLRSSG